MAGIEGEKPRKTEKPWGYELLFAYSEKYAGKIIFVEKGHRLSLQYHKVKDETIHVYSGKLRLEIEDDRGEMQAPILTGGLGMRIKPMRKHRMEALEDTYLFEVSTPELDDVVRLADDYGREDKSP
jgi:mannose-6-phosphate isomerase-like protein (cupin superfamily)